MEFGITSDRAMKININPKCTVQVDNECTLLVDFMTANLCKKNFCKKRLTPPQSWKVYT